MDVSRQRPDASRPSDPLIPYEAVQDACLHRELLKAGVAVDEADRICQDLSKAASDAVQVDTPATTDTCTRRLCSYKLMRAMACGQAWGRRPAILCR